MLGFWVRVRVRVTFRVRVSRVRSRASRSRVRVRSSRVRSSRVRVRPSFPPGPFWVSNPSLLRLGVRESRVTSQSSQA